MKKNLGIKTAIILVVLLVFLYGIFGTPHGLNGQSLVSSMLSESIFRNGIHLGLDLKGGTHLILQVQVNDAINTDAQQAIERLKADLKSGNADISQPDPKNHPELIQIKGLDPSIAGDLRTEVSEKLPEFDLSSQSGGAWTLTMKPSAAQAMKKNAVDQAIETIRNRIDTLGVTEPTIQEHGLGDYQILVQLPGVDDPERVKAVMQDTAMLEVRQSLGGPFGTEAAAMQALAEHPDGVVMKGRSIGAKTDTGEEWYILSRVPAVAGRDLKPGGARVGNDERNGSPDVSFALTNEGGRRFYNFTSAHVKDYLAIVLDNKVREVASINEPIHDQVRISGSFSAQEAKDLALVLNSGALPASIKYLEERTVGPSLGADSVRHGITAAVIGMAAVLVFMLVYYRAAGINANVGLILNLIILLGFLGFAGAALTLPGIAGVILTIGMGVDSNVLIFERIREEARNGKSAAAAVDQGFAHAWITIVDTHVTTIVSAVILFIFGSGPVRGFAITLLFGLLANLFTSVFVSRVIFDAALSRKQPGEALSI